MKTSPTETIRRAILTGTIQSCDMVSACLHVEFCDQSTGKTVVLEGAWTGRINPVAVFLASLPDLVFMFDELFSEDETKLVAAEIERHLCESPEAFSGTEITRFAGLTKPVAAPATV